MDADRRDWTNQHGYKVPTETEAIRHLTDEEMQMNKALQLYGIFVRSCCLVGFMVNKESEMQYLDAISKMTEWSLFVSKANHSISQ